MAKHIDSEGRINGGFGNTLTFINQFTGPMLLLLLFALIMGGFNVVPRLAVIEHRITSMEEWMGSRVGLGEYDNEIGNIHRRSTRIDDESRGRDDQILERLNTQSDMIIDLVKEK